MKNKLFNITVLALALINLGAVKPRFGGELSIRLNEPNSFAPGSDTYSNLIFSSLLYENLFYMGQDGSILSNVFSDCNYDRNGMLLTLQMKKNLSYSNGKAVTQKNIKTSLKVFSSLNLHQARRLNRALKSIDLQENNRILIALNFNLSDLFSILASPELILVADDDGVYSGPFLPLEWIKGDQMILQPNPFYPGGRSYLDTIRVHFDNKSRDLFLSEPKLSTQHYHEHTAGIYQNIYLCFPRPGGSINTRIALYTFLREFQKKSNSGYQLLDSLTSDDESPVAVKVEEFPIGRVNSILQQSNLILHVHSSLQNIEEKLTDFIKNRQSRINLVFFSHDDYRLMGEIDDSIPYMLTSKAFRRDTPAAEKLARIISELTFRRFDEKYLKMISELNEMKFMVDEALLLEQTARIVEEIVRDGFILPLFQKRFSLYVRSKFKDFELDYFGRPLVNRTHLDYD